MPQPEWPIELRSTSDEFSWSEFYYCLGVGQKVRHWIARVYSQLSALLQCPSDSTEWCGQALHRDVQLDQPCMWHQAYWKGPSSNHSNSQQMPVLVRRCIWRYDIRWQSHTVSSERGHCPNFEGEISSGPCMAWTVVQVKWRTARICNCSESQYNEYIRPEHEQNMSFSLNTPDPVSLTMTLNGIE